MDFSTRLKEEIEFADIRYKELAEKSGVPERALYNYVASKNPSMPPADVAVKIANALETTVEYLVLGKNKEKQTQAIDLQKIHKYAHLIEKIDNLSQQQQKLVQTIVIEMENWK